MLPLREQIKALENLQELDLKIDQLKKNRNALPVALKTVDDSITKLKTQIDSKKNMVAEMEKVQRQTQAALDINRDRLTRSTTRLESIQNSQEFAAINKEIEQLKKLNGSLEEQSKKTAGEIEAVNKELTDLDGNLEKLQAERNEKATAVTGQTSQVDGEISNLMAERAKHTPGVDPRILSQYDRVRNARAGLGLVPAVGGRCKGCNMVVPPQLYNEIQKYNQVHGCPSCHRILFVPAPSTGNPIDGTK